MYTKDIREVIEEENIVCMSPHYDDLLFFIGGYVLELKKQGLLETKMFSNVHMATRSNYQERDIQGNLDQSLKRVQFATGIRFIEDLECLDALFGQNNYMFYAMGEEESQVRGKIFIEGSDEMEMAFGSYETMDDKDYAILGRLTKKFKTFLVKENTAVILPLCIKGHIDHFLVREAGLHAIEELGKSRKAAVYFAEDKPYAGLMTQSESKINDDFIKEHSLRDIAFAHHPQTVLELAYRHYPSQVDKIFDTGIRQRNEFLKALYNTKEDCDRIYKL
jgi:hypothetical protein